MEVTLQVWRTMTVSDGVRAARKQGSHLLA